jgi:hypothetical protein
MLVARFYNDRQYELLSYLSKCIKIGLKEDDGASKIGERWVGKLGYEPE